MMFLLSNSRDARILAIPDVETIESFYSSRSRLKSKTRPNISPFARCRSWRWQTWWWWRHCWYDISSVVLISKSSIMDQRIRSTRRRRSAKIWWRWGCLIRKLFSLTFLFKSKIPINQSIIEVKIQRTFISLKYQCMCEWVFHKNDFEVRRKP